jgi:two-component system NtrC family response regulator
MQIRRQQKRQNTPQSLEELKELKQNILNEVYVPLEKSFLRKALRDADGNITRAAGNIGMQRSNFSSLIKKYDISAEEFRNSSGGR